LASHRIHTAFHPHVCTSLRYLSNPLARPHTNLTSHSSPPVVPLPSTRTIQNPTHDSNAPRRQLDGGVAPAADGRGGDRARPGSACCCAVLVGWSPRRRLSGGASSRHPVGRCRRGRHGQDACHDVGRWAASTMRCPPVRCRRPGPAVQPSGGPAVRCPAVRCPAGCCPPRRSGRVRLVPPQAVALGTRSRGRAPYITGTGRGMGAPASWSGSIDGRAGPDAGDAVGVACWSVADPGRGVGERRPRLTAERPGRPGRRAGRRR
jgi:hypothetical protein